MSMNRRTLIRLAPVGAAAMLLPNQASHAHPAAGTISASRVTRPDTPPLPASYPTHDPSLVRDMVGASHSRIDRVRELLATSPTLALATWDWGFGDWETALGAASHVGNRDIAQLLIDHGARPDLFTLAMLGHLNAVKACIEAIPGIQRTRGPHGISLLKHAKAGGDHAAPVVDYLSQLGGADPVYTSLELPPEWADRYVGDYALNASPPDLFTISKSDRGVLSIKRRSNAASSRLFHQGNHLFHPAGAPHATVRFEVEHDRVLRISIRDGLAEVSAAKRTA